MNRLEYARQVFILRGFGRLGDRHGIAVMIAHTNSLLLQKASRPPAQRGEPHGGNNWLLCLKYFYYYDYV